MKRLLFCILFILNLSVFCFAADQKLTDKTADTTLPRDAIIYEVLDPGGTPLSRKITIDNAFHGDKIEVSELNTASYDDVQDWMNNTQSSGKIFGGAFTTNGDGSCTVAAGVGIIRATNSDMAETLQFNWAEDTSVSLVDNSTNYIYVDYNSGTPDIKSTTTKTTANNRDKILLGKIYREGTTLHEVEAGMVITELARRVLTYLNGVNGEIVRATGLVTTETGALNLAVTAGTGFGGLTPISWSSIDTTGADTFRYWYNNGTWQDSAVSVINATQYNDYGTGLAALTNNNHYGTHYLYMHFEGDLHVVYGIASYSTVAEAEAAPTPSNLPSIVSDFSLYIGKIIINKLETTTFTDVRYPWTDSTTTGLTGNHNDLSGLQGGTTGEYYHTTSAQNTVITNTSGTNTGDNSANTTYTIGSNTQAWDADLDTLATPTAWRFFYSNGSNVLIELALGADGTYIMSNGAAVAPTFETPGGSGDITSVLGKTTGDVPVLFQTWTAFTAADATPDVSTKSLWKTADTTTITDFDGTPVDGQFLYLYCAHAGIIDLTASGIEAANRTTDWTMVVGTIVAFKYQGSQWYAQNMPDAVADISSNGFIARTGAGTAAARELIGGTAITVTNGTGGGDPNISVTNNTIDSDHYVDGSIDLEHLSAGAKFQSFAVASLGDATTPSVLTTAETINKTISNYKGTGADHVFTMPAPHAAGNVIFPIGDEFQVDVEPNSGDLFYLNGTAMAVDEHIQNTSDTLGTQLTGYCVNINGTLRWMFSSNSSDWVEATP